MAVPITNPKLSDVCLEMYDNANPAGKTLLGLFGNSSEGFFDPTYNTSLNSLLKFRNYKHAVPKTLLFSTSNGPNEMIRVGDSLYVADYDMSIVQRNGISNSTFNGDVDGDNFRVVGVKGLCSDPFGTVYVTGHNSHSVGKISPGNNASYMGQVGRNPTSITYANGFVYTANTGSNSISKVNVSTNAVTNFANVGREPVQILQDSYGNFYVLLYGDEKVQKITTAGVVTTLGSVGSRPRRMFIDVSNNIYVTNSTSNSITIFTNVSNGSYSPASLWIANTNTTSIVSQPWDIYVSPQGSAYVTCRNDNRVLRIRLVTKEITVFATVASGPINIIGGVGNELYVLASTTFANGGTLPYGAVYRLGDI